MVEVQLYAIPDRYWCRYHGNRRSQKEWISILGNFGVAILLRELYNGLLLQGTRRVGLLLLQRGMGIPTHARLRGRLHVLLLQGQGVLRHRPCTAAVVLLRPNVWERVGAMPPCSR